MVRNKLPRNEHKEERAIDFRIISIGILLVAGILISILMLNSSVIIVASAANSVDNANVDKSNQQQIMDQKIAALPKLRNVTDKQRRDAAVRIKQQSMIQQVVTVPAIPGGTPDYFGMTPNYANSPVPIVDPVNMTITGGIRKFVDSLPAVGPNPVPGAVLFGANNLGKYMPLAVADSITYTNSDYYEIGLVQYTEKMHSDLNNTTLRGYVQLETAANAGVSKHIALKYPNGTNITSTTGVQVFAVDDPHYLGPLVIAQKDRPVRVKFINYLPTGTGGNLFIPADTSVMGSGMGGLYANGTPCDSTLVGAMCANYSENRATLHLHGGRTPWISDGTMHQWVTPAGENTQYPKGVSVAYVPDMDGGAEPNGTLTFYYTNQQSARLMFYHDHAYGITRLNVYAGEAAGYLIQDPVEQTLVNGGNITMADGTNVTVPAGTIPDLNHSIPLVIQDKGFVDANTIASQDPTWNWGTTPPVPNTGDLWFPHVYMPNQNPHDITGANPMGRWDYGPWFFPPQTGLMNGPLPNPLSGTTPQEGPVNPGTPNPSIVPEAFVDTPLVNGNAYPNLTVGQTAYRFWILNAANDRYWNLQLYYASTAGPFVVISGGNGTGASATATVNASGSITGITVTSGGAGFNATPNVTIFDAPGHVGAAGTATGSIGSITVPVPGSGYTAPVVTITDPTGTGAMASVIALTYPGSGIYAINVTNGGNGYTAPVVTITDPTGTGASATATLIGTSTGFTPAAVSATVDLTPGSPTYGTITGISVTNGGSGYSVPTICKGTAVTNSSLCTEVSMVPAVAGAANFPASWLLGTPGLPLDILDSRAGGVPDPVAIGPQMVQIGTEGGFLPAPAMIENRPVGYEKNTRSITVTNVLEKALFLGPAERADVIVDFSGVLNGSTLILYNDAPAPVPAFDPRNDYYTNAIDNTLTGGAPSTVPGYGPNTRTIMQIQVNNASGSISMFNVTNLTTALPAAYSAIQDVPLVPQAAYNAAFNASYPQDGYARIQDTSMTFLPAAASQPVRSVTLTAGGSNYTSAPNVTITGGNGTNATAITTLATAGGVRNIVVTNPGTRYTSIPTVTISAPTTVGGITATAVATVNLTTRTVTGISVTNPGSGYTSIPTVTISAPSAGGTRARATAVLGFAVAGITLTNGGSGYTSDPAVNISGGGGSGAAATASINLTMNMEPKAIQELFEFEYGRMNALLGMEFPKPTLVGQVTLPFTDIDPPTEVIKTSMSGAPLGTLGDGTQIWKITHNGVDTHSIHWHMFNVQLINRVGWDGMIKPPDPNEEGWKETIRMNPLEDVIVAVRPIKPDIPWDLPNSIRPLDVTAPLGTTIQFGASNGFQAIDPNNNPITIVNHLVNYGWEYVWHCHLLGHEENIMMRPIAIALPPMAPINLVATPGINPPNIVNLTWTDNSKSEVSFVIQRAANVSGVPGPWTTIATVPSTTGPQIGGTMTYIDTTVTRRTTYFYQVMARNVVGDTTVYPAPAVGFPTITVDSVPVVAGPVTTN